MARLARIVVPGLPHPVTHPFQQRRGQAFFEKGDYAPYRDVLAEAGARDRTTGQLWQGRYGPVVMDGDRLLDAVRCVTRNPACAIGAQTGRALMRARRGPHE